MPDETQGTAQQTGQPETGNQAAEQQPQSTQQSAQASQAAPTTQPQSNQEVEALRKELEQAKAHAKHYQSQFDQMRQRAQAVTQEPVQQDPLKPYIEKLTARGMHADDARAIAEVQYEMVRPLQDQLTRANAAVQGITQVDAAMEKAVADNPNLFRDPRVFQHARNELVMAAQSGQSNYVTPEYAAVCGQMGYVQTFKPWEQQPQQPPANLPQTIRWNGGQPGYTPAQQPAKQENPLTAQYEKQMRDYTGIPQQQPQQ